MAQVLGKRLKLQRVVDLCARDSDNSDQEFISGSCHLAKLTANRLAAGISEVIRLRQQHTAFGVAQFQNNGAGGRRGWVGQTGGRC